MSAATGTRIFGIKMGVDPKIVVGALFAIALLLFFLYGRGDDSNTAATTPTTGLAPVTTTRETSGSSPARRTRRRGQLLATMDRGSIRIRPVDATRGDIDPTLRIDMLQRLQHVAEPSSTRSLFEIGEAMPTTAAIQKVNQVIQPAPVAQQDGTQTPPGTTVPAQPTIPLKFYGFVKSARRAAVNRGLFLEGDNVIVASEGQTIDGRYLVVTLTAENARIEDTQLKQGQTLQVEAQALPQ